jgi:hypothetical protein
MIEQALKTVKPAPSVGERESLTTELEQLQQAQKALLPVEDAALMELEAKIAAIQTKVDYGKAAEALQGLSLLDTSVFSWTKLQKTDGSSGPRRKELELPVFAFIPIAQSEFVATLSWTGLTTYGYSLPLGVRSAYDRIFNAVANKYLSFDGYGELRLSYRYLGVIPDDVREIIRKEQVTPRFERLALVCETDQWQTSWTKAPPPELFDPILVGERAGVLWVLAAFDPTPVEQYLLNEFTTK